MMARYERLLPVALREPGNIEWVQVPEYADLYNIVINGRDVGWITKRPAYCDRGHWQVNITLPDLDGADGYPRYYMSRKAAVSETEAFLKWRLWQQRGDAS